MVCLWMNAVLAFSYTLLASISGNYTVFAELTLSIVVFLGGFSSLCAAADALKMFGFTSTMRRDRDTPGVISHGHRQKSGSVYLILDAQQSVLGLRLIEMIGLKFIWCAASSRPRLSGRGFVKRIALRTAMYLSLKGSRQWSDPLRCGDQTPTGLI
ncbi:MAG: hypothetical protein P8L66_13030 [Rhodospirillaceae bacterium]|nr:hypothetical protein [Rhodospirillaceae bacterium]